MKEPKHKLFGTAETLFIEQGSTCNAISEQLGISVNTLSKWRGAFEWDAKRDSLLSTPRKIRELLLKELQQVAAGEKPTIDADSLSKVSKALSLMEGRVSLPVVISVFKEFDMWVAEVDPQQAIRFTEFHRMFVTHKAQQESR